MALLYMDPGEENKTRFCEWYGRSIVGHVFNIIEPPHGKTNNLHMRKQFDFFNFQKLSHLESDVPVGDIAFHKHIF